VGGGGGAGGKVLGGGQIVEQQVAQEVIDLVGEVAVTGGGRRRRELGGGDRDVMERVLEDRVLGLEVLDRRLLLRQELRVAGEEAAEIRLPAPVDEGRDLAELVLEPAQVVQFRNEGVVVGEQFVAGLQ